MKLSEQHIESLLAAPDFLHDPYPAYRALLESESPHWSDARGAWLISRYDQVVGAYRDWRHFSSAGRVGALLDHFSEADWEQLEGLRRWTDLRGIIHADPPEHTQFRSLFTRAFTTKTVDGLKPKVETLVDGLIDAVAARGSLDVVADVALPLPAAVISHILGVPDADRDKFVSWSDAALGIRGRQRPTLAIARRASEAYASLQDYFAGLIARRREQMQAGRQDGDGFRTDDFVTGMIVATDANPDMGEANVIQSCITLLMGGYETTTSLIANTMVIQLQRPELRSRLAENPSGLANLIEESLRFECPIQTVTRRVNEDIVIRESRLREGDLAILMMGAANRDPRQFPEPDRFDPDRKNRHIAFGYGIHLCVGATLARLEAPIAVSRMLARLPELALLSDTIAWNEDKPVTRCPSSLPVSFRAGRNTSSRIF